MSKIYKEQSNTTRIKRSVLKKKNEELLKTLELEGFQQKDIEELRMKEEYQMNFPSNIFNEFLLQAMNVIFSNSDCIHPDILISIIKGLSSIDINEISNVSETTKGQIGKYSEKIMDEIIKNMESLYYFHDDFVFNRMIFDLCLELDLDPEEYGFTFGQDKRKK